MINKVIIMGTVADLKVTFDADGKPCCSFTLKYEQAYGEGRTSKLFIPIDVTPSRSEAVGEMLNNGDTALIDGSLKWRSWTDKRTGERQGKLAVLAWQVEKILTPAMVESAN
jgi:single-stranded DNA-binding protein